MKNKFANRFFIQRSLINTITTTRLIALVILYIYPTPIFIVGLSIGVGISDFIDGYLARLWKCETPFGKILDQSVDKIVAIVFLLFYLHLQEVQGWFVYLFILRELLVVFGRSIKIIESSSNYYGKVKMFLLYIFIVFISYKNYNSQFFSNAYSEMVLLFEIGILFFSYLAVFNSIQKNIQDRVVVMIGSTFYSAFLIKKMPGTVSSLIVFTILYYFSDIAIAIKIAVTAICIIAHFLVYPLFEKIYQEEDVGFYTMDETIAVLLFWMIAFQGPLIWAIGFSLFRFFDILKPLGIKKLESTFYLKKSMRILADDLLAILYTLIISYAIKQYV